MGFINNSNVNPFSEHILLWKRNIDDVFVIFKRTAQFTSFADWLNDIHPSIKFVGISNKEEIDFLDTCVYKDSKKKLAFRVDRKPTDKKALLHYCSHHSRNLTNNLPFGQFLRLKRNSTSLDDYLREERILSRQLRERGYPARVIEKAKSKAAHRTRQSLLTENPTQPKNRITCGL